MRRGKDDEKIMGPMFPRLHVNDADKGGPRAPPRNKMALYEQLSIPSQRFNHVGLPLNPSSTKNLVPPGSSSQIQGGGLERNLHFPLDVPTTPNHLANKLSSHEPNGGHLNTSIVQREQKTNLGDEDDDFRVPVFVHSRMGQYSNMAQNGIDQEKHTSCSPNCLGHSKKIQDVGGDVLRHDVRNHNEEKLCVPSRNHLVRSSMNLRTREKISGSEEEANASPSQQFRDHSGANIGRLREDDVCLQQEPTSGMQPNHSGCSDDVPDLMSEKEKGNIAQARSDSYSREDPGSNNNPEIDSDCCGDGTHVSPQLVSGDKSDDISETSMVDSISALQMSPDDVVGIIGQNHFWKARRAIVNQQRVFAVQVFELHRLIKVQRLIAGSPHLLLEDGSYLGNPSMKVSPAKKLPSECVVMPPVHVAKCKDDSDKSNHKMECSAENAVGKALSSVKNAAQPSNYLPYFGNPTPVSAGTDTKMGPWCFTPSLGHQWLVPVMSPSEGLVYKPYTAPGFTGMGCRGCGPFGQTPLTGNFADPAYGVPASYHHNNQGIGVLQGASPVVHCYFPPYGMPVVNPAISSSTLEQMNYFAGTGSHGQVGQLSQGEANSNMQHQSSCNVPTQKSGTVPQVAKFQASKDTELLGSTASSPGERAQGVGQSADGRDALPLFPVASATPERASRPRETEQPTRVIKVMPHNPRSATESAARIFKSIQEERKQYDSI